jgi:hypothetical protein
MERRIQQKKDDVNRLKNRIDFSVYLMAVTGGGCRRIHSVVVLESWSWSRGASRPFFAGLGLGLGPSGLGLGLGLELYGLGLGLATVSWF